MFNFFVFPFVYFQKPLWMYHDPVTQMKKEKDSGLWLSGVYLCLGTDQHWPLVLDDRGGWGRYKRLGGKVWLRWEGWVGRSRSSSSPEEEWAVLGDAAGEGLHVKTGRTSCLVPHCPPRQLTVNAIKQRAFSRCVSSIHKPLPFDLGFFWAPGQEVLCVSVWRGALRADAMGNLNLQVGRDWEVLLS